jgi:NitT/TauT family transport system substrate-binding protein
MITTLAAGCGSATASTSDARPEKPDLTVAVVAAEASAGLYIAADRGLFAKAGLHVTLKTVTSPTVALPGLLHGGIDIISGQLSTFISAQAAGLARFRVLATGFSLGPRVEAITVPEGSPITAPQQLRGATVAVNAIGGIDQILAEASLSAYQISPRQVHYVAVPFQSMGAALASHRVDAAYLTEPYLTEAEQQQGAAPLLDPDAGPAQDLPFSAYMTTAAWASRYPRTAQAFAKAVTQGNLLAATNLTVFEKAMEDQLHIPPVVADVMATGSFPLGVDEVQLQRVATFMYEYGALKHPFNIKAMLR